ncbi:MAG: DUF3795 domain-containing protein [Methanosarcinales archaeon]|nr:DUF3795 domain-containing protein [Methanosarcinales archaeon]
MIKSYGKCGNACELCIHYDLSCNGCLAENKDKSKIYNCIIFDCATDKKVQSCLSCIEYPCDLIRGLSRSYCPIHSVKFVRFHRKK